MVGSCPSEINAIKLQSPVKNVVINTPTANITFP